MQTTCNFLMTSQLLSKVTSNIVQILHIHTHSQPCSQLRLFLTAYCNKLKHLCVMHCHHNLRCSYKQNIYTCCRKSTRHEISVGFLKQYIVYKILAKVYVCMCTVSCMHVTKPIRLFSPSSC